MPEPLLIRLPEVAWEQAGIWEAKLLKALYARNPGANYTGLEGDHRYGFGFMGETGTRDLLWVREKKWYYRAHPDGLSHGGTDLKVWRKDGRPVTIDVKTASKHDHRYFMMTEAQFKRHRAMLYVGVRLLSTGWGEGEWAEVWGWMTRKELEEVPVTTRTGLGKKVKGRYVLLRRMPHSMDELLEKLVDDEPHFLLKREHEPTSDILLDPAVVDSDRLLCATGNDMGAEGEHDRDVDSVRDNRDKNPQTQLVMRL